MNKYFWITNNLDYYCGENNLFLTKSYLLQESFKGDFFCEVNDLTCRDISLTLFPKRHGVFTVKWNLDEDK